MSERERASPERRKKMREKAVFLLSLLSLLFFSLVKLIGEKPPEIRKEMVQAAKLMSEATLAVRHCREEKGVGIDPRFDPNRTGLIGLDYSPITTSLGNLEAKRTTTNPNLAGLLVHLLWEAGARRGDAVAIGASSSFPALIIASLCAAQALGLEPLLICSLGASQWGANNPDFHWLDIRDCLEKTGLLRMQPLAISLGGEGDRGQDMDPQGRDFLLAEAERRGYSVLPGADLPQLVRERIRLYNEAAGGKQIKVFINIGGSFTNLGTDSKILNLKPGLTEFRNFPPPEKRGLIFEMGSHGIPVIHLLYIRGLIERYEFPWDPRPLPAVGVGAIYDKKRLDSRLFFILAAFYLVLVGGLFPFIWNK